MRGNSVEIILPRYDCLRYDRICGLTVAYDDLWVPWFSGTIHCTVWFGWFDGRKNVFHRAAFGGALLWGSRARRVNRVEVHCLRYESAPASGVA